MLPSEEADNSSNSGDSISTGISTSMFTTAVEEVTAKPPPLPPSSGMFAAVLDQLRAELSDERRKREALEARQRQLASHLCLVVDEQIRSVKAIKQLVQGVREGKEDHLNEMLTIMKRMRAAWGMKKKLTKKSFGKRIKGARIE